MSDIYLNSSNSSINPTSCSFLSPRQNPVAAGVLICGITAIGLVAAYRTGNLQTKIFKPLIAGVATIGSLGIYQMIFSRLFRHSPPSQPNSPLNPIPPTPSSSSSSSASSSSSSSSSSSTSSSSSSSASSSSSSSSPSSSSSNSASSSSSPSSGSPNYYSKAEGKTSENEGSALTTSQNEQKSSLEGFSQPLYNQGKKEIAETESTQTKPLFKREVSGEETKSMQKLKDMQEKGIAFTFTRFNQGALYQRLSYESSDTIPLDKRPTDDLESGETWGGSCDILSHSWMYRKLTVKGDKEFKNPGIYETTDPSIPYPMTIGDNRGVDESLTFPVTEENKNSNQIYLNRVHM